MWEPGTTPKLVNPMTYLVPPYLGPYAGVTNTRRVTHSGSRSPHMLVSSGQCSGGTIPVLCYVVGVIGPEIALDSRIVDGAVVALDVRGVDVPALPHGVVTASTPERVTFATDLIGAALDAEGGAS